MFFESICFFHSNFDSFTAVFINSSFTWSGVVAPFKHIKDESRWSFLHVSFYGLRAVFLGIGFATGIRDAPFNTTRNFTGSMVCSSNICSFLDIPWIVYDIINSMMYHVKRSKCRLVFKVEELLQWRSFHSLKLFKCEFISSTSAWIIVHAPLSLSIFPWISSRPFEVKRVHSIVKLIKLLKLHSFCCFKL